MATTALSSLEIAQEAKLRPITEIAAAAGLEPDELDLYGTYKAKVSLSVVDRLADALALEPRFSLDAYSRVLFRSFDSSSSLSDCQCSG